MSEDRMPPAERNAEELVRCALSYALRGPRPEEVLALGGDPHLSADELEKGRQQLLTRIRAEFGSCGCDVGGDGDGRESDR